MPDDIRGVYERTRSHAAAGGHHRPSVDVCTNAFTLGRGAPWKPDRTRRGQKDFFALSCAIPRQRRTPLLTCVPDTQRGDIRTKESRGVFLPIGRSTLPKKTRDSTRSNQFVGAGLRKRSLAADLGENQSFLYKPVMVIRSVPVPALEACKRGSSLVIVTGTKDSRAVRKRKRRRIYIRHKEHAYRDS